MLVTPGLAWPGLVWPVSWDHDGCQILNIALLDIRQRDMNYVSQSVSQSGWSSLLNHSDCWYVGRRRLSRLELYRVDTYCRVVGQTRDQVRASRLGRTSSEEYGRMVAVRGRGQRGTTRPHTATDSRDSRGSTRSQSQTHWAYFRSDTTELHISICPPRTTFLR